MAHDQAYLKAEQKIQQAMKSGVTELDLRSMKLTELPESIGQLVLLEELNLYQNEFTHLPDSMSKLTNLKRLLASRNKFNKIPEVVFTLRNLEKIVLSETKIIKVDEKIGNLKKLQILDLSNNQLTFLPDSLGQLTQLTELNLSNNQLTALPDWLGQLTQLQRLNLDSNYLQMIPELIGNLSKLTYLRFSNNNITRIPSSLRRLSSLESLAIGGPPGGNLIMSLPDWLGDLEKIHTLWLQKNQLSDLPSSLAHLEHLKIIQLDGNPLNPALQSAYDACESPNYEPLWAYLRSLEQNAEPLYEAKLVLVGEGNVGKTTLLKALKGKKGEGAPKQGEPTTHGVEIDIHGLKLPHPDKDGVEIQLNAWDFGGQDVYRVTHQFFFSRRSLYLLVWEPRRGVQQCQVEDWLNMIRLRVGDNARVIIVSTYSTSGEHIARIDKPVFKQQYGDMIVGFHEVDSLVPDDTTGEMVGIAELKKVIAEHASKLEQMGMLFNNDWKAARDELLAHIEPRISYTVFGEICAKHNLSQIDADTLAHLMHDLGYIVHYSEDEKLRDDVVLKPEWLTKAIGFVLENRDTAEREGILPDNQLYKVWHDHAFPDEPRYTSDLYPFFLRLMEKYDVSYRLPEERHASLVAQHVPQVRPALPWLPEDAPQANLRRIAMICAMEEDPPGLVPWMIVRTHDYAADGNHHWLHWQKGMFLRHSPHGEAMLEKRGLEFHVYTQADWPEYFMNVLQHTLQKLITDNWPGLEGRYGFMVPCPETVNGQPCKGRFKIQALRKFLVEGDTHVRCQECSCRLSIAELLFGFEERDMSVQLREIQEQLAQAREQITGLDSRIANYFMAMMRAIADEAKNGPRLFTFRQREAGLSPKQLFSRPLELQLWCEHEGHPHPVTDPDKGVYTINQPYEWVVKIAPYANFVLDVLKTVAPMATPAINVVKGSKTTENWGIKDHLELAKAIIDKLPAEIKTPDRALSPGQMLSEPERSGILALHRFLNEADPAQAKLGLHRVATYTGDYRWLCDFHYKAWQPNIPDVIR